MSGLKFIIDVMYKRLARILAANPLRWVVGWLLLVIFTASAAFTGFGDPLFNRLNTDVPAATPSESWEGQELIAAELPEKYGVVAYIEGVDLQKELDSSAGVLDRIDTLKEDAEGLGEKAKALGDEAQKIGDDAQAFGDLAQSKAGTARDRAATAASLGAQAQSLGEQARKVGGQAAAAGAQAQSLAAEAHKQAAAAQAAGKEAKSAQAEAESLGAQAAQAAARAETAAAAGDIAGAGEAKTEAENLRSQATAAGAKARAAGERAATAGASAKKLGADASAAGERARSLKAQAQSLGKQAEQIGAQARATGADAKALGDEAKILGDKAKNLGNEAKAKGEEATELGEEATELGDKAKELSEPDWPVAKALHNALSAPLAEIEKMPRVTAVAHAFVEPNAMLDPQARQLVGRSGDSFVIAVTMNVADSAGGIDKGLYPEIIAVEKALTSLQSDIKTALDTAKTDASKLKISVTDERITNDLGIGLLMDDLVRSESIGIPLSFLIMVLVFGGVLAALMPLSSAMVAISTSLAIILALTYVADQQSFSVNVISVLGLGLSIDYGLLIVSRYRETLQSLHGRDTASYAPDLSGVKSQRKREKLSKRDPRFLHALETTLSTAGRTVLFSALTVAISISGMMFFTPELLKSLGIAGISVVLLALACALTLVPALIILAGSRMEKPSLITKIPGLKQLHVKLGEVYETDEVQDYTGDTGNTEDATPGEKNAQPQPHGAKKTEERVRGLPGLVVRYPWPFLLVTVALLITAALPIGNLQLRNSLLEMFPTDYPTRTVLTAMQKEVPALGFPQVQVVATEITPESLDKWMQDAAKVDGVAEVFSAQKLGTNDAVATIRLHTDDAGSRKAETTVAKIRKLPHDFTRYVVGQTANQMDFVSALAEGLPWALTVVVLATMVLLFLMTGSVVIPLQALVFNTLSIIATLGIATLVFVEGYGVGLLGGETLGGLESYVIVMLVCFGFGLATDYQMFLLSRIKEVWDTTRNNKRAVALGVRRTERIILSAASILILVFFVFMAGEMIVLKEVGFIMGMIVSIDALVVRMFLVPSTMAILGRVNWWAPGFLRRLHSRIGLEH